METTASGVPGKGQSSEESCRPITLLLLCILTQKHSHITTATKFRRFICTQEQITKFLTATVADVLTTSPRQLCGDAAERLTSHLVTARAKNGILQIRQSAQGPPQTVTCTTQGRVGSDAALTRTVQRRSASELQQHKTTVCGSASGLSTCVLEQMCFPVSITHTFLSLHSFR
eukprot:scpid100365/ scgid28777/ 